MGGSYSARPLSPRRKAPLDQTTPTHMIRLSRPHPDWNSLTPRPRTATRPANPGRPLATSPWSWSPRTDFQPQRARPLYIPDAEDLLGVRDSERKEAQLRGEHQRPASASMHAPQARKPFTEQDKVVEMTRDALNNHFTHVRDAFRKLDLDNSMTLSRSEIKRAMQQWNIPVSNEVVDGLLMALDKNGDDAISYDEFVKVLARDTVVASAMSTTGMRGTLQERPATPGRPQSPRSLSSRADPQLQPLQRPASATKRVQVYDANPEKLLETTRDVLNNKFTHMRDAFRKLDLDNSMTLSKKEMRQAMKHLNIPVTDEMLTGLLLALDKNGDDAISYDELVKVLARDTVVASAMI